VTALPQGQLAPAASVSAPLSAANARSDFNIGYCGYRFNGDIGAYTVRFRHYDPTPGMCRWLERDPAGYQDGPSLYSYLGRNPMAGTDPYGLFYSGSGITVIGPDQIRPPVGANELVNPPGYGLRPTLLAPDMPGYNEVVAWVEALSAVAKSNADRGVNHGGGIVGALEQVAAFFVGMHEGQVDGAILILDNFTCGWVPGLNRAANQVRTANAGSWAYTVADWSAAVGTTLLPIGAPVKMAGITGRAVGATARAGSNALGAAAAATAALAKRVVRTEKHHAIPRFLGGFKKQDTIALAEDVHREFHSVLRQMLRDRGLPHVGGASGSGRVWEQLMMRNRGTQRIAFDAVLKASRLIDARHGTSITQAFWREVMAGRFTPYP
jgi:RHS repeat-associated protein